MTKLRIPLLSFQAHGSLAHDLTFQHRSGIDLVRTKPIPTDPYSLPQAYQRWLYQDYAAYWHSLTPAQQFNWTKLARRRRLTGFNYFMSVYLETLADISAGWRFDERTGFAAIDFSDNANNLTIVGATHAPGPIDYALSFDGIDDRAFITAPTNIPTGGADRSITFHLFLRSYAKDWRVLSYGTAAIGKWFAILALKTSGNLYLAMYNNDHNSNTPIPLLQWSAIGLSLTGSTTKLYLNGNLISTRTDHTTINTTPSLLAVASDNTESPLKNYLDGIIDHLVIYNRTLTDQDHKRIAERSYPT